MKESRVEKGMNKRRIVGEISNQLTYSKVHQLHLLLLHSTIKLSLSIHKISQLVWQFFKKKKKRKRKHFNKLF